MLLLRTDMLLLTTDRVQSYCQKSSINLINNRLATINILATINSILDTINIIIGNY